MPEEKIVRKPSLDTSIIIAFALALTITAAASYILDIPTSGITTTKDMTADPSSINWGTVTVGEPATKTATLTNTGNTPFTLLNMTTSNVKGLTSFTCTWNLEGAELNPAENIIAEFTLTVHSHTETNFSFDIIITEG